MISYDEFKRRSGVTYGNLETVERNWIVNEAVLPCFIHRRPVTRQIRTPQLIEAAIHWGCASSKNDVIAFSVTELDGAAWQAWIDYAKAHPRKFKVVQGGSIHGRYQARLYLYTKPKSKRKYKV